MSTASDVWRCLSKVHVWTAEYLYTDQRGRRSRCSCTSRSTVCQQPAVAHSLSQPSFSGTLPDDVQSAPSVSSFRRQLLKTFLFHQSFKDIVI